MSIIINSNRSLKNIFLTATAIIVVALSASPSTFAQSANHTQALVQNSSVVHNVESFVSSVELLQNEVQFTPASLDMNALKRSIAYPEAAIKRNVSGRFELIVYVNSNGNVNSVNFLTERADDSAMNALIASACEAVKKSTFTPAMLNHKAINSTVRIPFHFVL